MKTRHLNGAILAGLLGLTVTPGWALDTNMVAREMRCQWNWGDAADVNESQPCHVTQPERIGAAGQEGATRFRALMPNVYQVGFVMPAFDFDPQDDGAIRHPFYLTFRFKDIASKPIFVYAGKGGCGFYGAGYVGSIGGAADGQWKEETVIIRRSMMRNQDGQSFRFALNNIKAPVPVASCTLWSAASPLPGTAARAAAALQAETDRRNAVLARLLPRFKNLGLPDPGPCADYTAAEKSRGFRVFFPPINRWLFENSNPRPEELTDTKHVSLCPGQSHSLLVAVRGLKDLGAVAVKFSDLNGSAHSVTLANIPVRWAVYSPQRIGASWGADYQVCLEQLAEAPSQAVSTSRLEMACLTFTVPADAAAGKYSGTMTITSQKGGTFVVPIDMTVYPFSLEHPNHATHGQFYYADLINPCPMELRDMHDHGMDTLVSGMMPYYPVADTLDWGPVVKGFELLKRLGYRSPLIISTEGIAPLATLDPKKPEGDPAKRRKHADVIAKELQVAKAAGFEDTAFFPVDEPHADPVIAQAKYSCTWIKDVPGARTYITSNPKAVSVLGPVLDDVCYNLTYLNNQTVAGVVSNKQTLMFYCPGFEVDPSANRYRAGYYFAKLGAYSCRFYAYGEVAVDPFNDLDGDNRDWTVVYPSMTSATHDPTLEWEALREGVDDYRYVYTLRSRAQRARDKGHGAEADKAIKVLNEVLSVVDLDGNKAGGPAMQIEADTSLKDRKLDAKELTKATTDVTSAWYDQSRAKLAAAIISLEASIMK